LTEITQWILPHMVRIGEPAAGSLGHDMEKLREAERRMILVLDELWRNLRLTIVEGDRTASAPGFSLGERFKAHQLVLRAMKLSYAVQGGDRGALASWCQGVAGLYDGRMVHAFHYFLEEARAATRLEEDYPLRPAALKIREACEALLDAVIELRLQPSGRVAGQPVPDPDP
jgi:hypothetical protein